MTQSVTAPTRCTGCSPALPQRCRRPHNPGSPVPFRSVGRCRSMHRAPRRHMLCSPVSSRTIRQGAPPSRRLHPSSHAKWAILHRGIVCRPSSRDRAILYAIWRMSCAPLNERFSHSLRCIRKEWSTSTCLSKSVQIHQSVFSLFGSH